MIKYNHFIVTTFIILIIIAYGYFNSDNNFQQEKKSFNQTMKNKINEISEPHWNHLPIRYKLDEYCKTRWNGELGKDIRRGIEYIENETVVTFIEVDSNEDIFYTCDPELKKTSDSDTLAEAETFLEGNNYTYGIIYFYKSYNCVGQAPTLWVHETLHLLGLNDKTKSDWLDIMWGIEDGGKNCNRLYIVEKDKQYLKNIYGAIK